MDLDSLKGKTLDDALLGELKAHVGTITTTADAKVRAANKESAEGRTTLKAHLAKALEKLGVDDAAALDGLPDARGQAEALAQFDTKLKRAEREGAEAKTALEQMRAQVSAAKRDSLIASAASKQGFQDAAIAATLISAQVRQEGEDFLFDAGGGKLISIEEGAAHIAKASPFLVTPAGQGGQGSGYGSGRQQFQQSKGDLGGNKSERTAAIAARFPTLPLS